MNGITSPLSLDIPGAVAASGIGRTKLFEAMKLGKLRARKYGRKTIILVSDLDDFLKSLPVKEAA